MRAYPQPPHLFPRAHPIRSLLSAGRFAFRSVRAACDPEYRPRAAPLQLRVSSASPRNCAQAPQSAFVCRSTHSVRSDCRSVSSCASSSRDCRLISSISSRLRWRYAISSRASRDSRRGLRALISPRAQATQAAARFRFRSTFPARRPAAGTWAANVLRRIPSQRSRFRGVVDAYDFSRSWCVVAIVSARRMRNSSSSATASAAPSSGAVPVPISSTRISE